MGSQEVSVKLLGAWYSPFVKRVEWALKLKGIEYEFEEVNLAKKSSLLLQCNPIYKGIPVLIHAGKPVIESLHIVEYIDETWKHNPILPQDPYEKALVRSLAKFIEEQLHDVIRRALVFEGEKQEKEVKKAISAMEVLEEEVNYYYNNKGRKFFGGETIGFLDIVLGFITVWLAGIEEAACIKVFDSLKFPLLHNWKRTFLISPFIKETLPSGDKLVPFFLKYRRLSLATAKEINGFH